MENNSNVFEPITVDSYLGPVTEQKPRRRVRRGVLVAGIVLGVVAVCAVIGAVVVSHSNNSNTTENNTDSPANLAETIQSNIEAALKSRMTELQAQAPTQNKERDSYTLQVSSSAEEGADSQATQVVHQSLQAMSEASTEMSSCCVFTSAFHVFNQCGQCKKCFLSYVYSNEVKNFNVQGFSQTGVPRAPFVRIVADTDC